MGLPHNVPTLKLYRNLGDRTFQDVTRQVENEVFRTAMERVKREDLVRTAFERDNMSASEAAAKFGVM